MPRRSSMQVDGLGNAWFFWNAITNGLKKVYYQRVEPDGKKTFDWNGKLVDDNSSEQLSPVMGVNPDGKVLFFWVEKGAEGNCLYR